MPAGEKRPLPYFGTIERPPRHIVEGFRGLGTSTIGNVLDDLGIGGIMLNIRPVAPGTSFVGTAFTVKEVTGVHGTYSPAEFGLGHVVDNAGDGDVIIIDNGGHQVSTWGGVASFAAQRRGVTGLVIDGGLRDADEIRELGFAAFSRHIVPLSGKSRIKVIEVNTVVKVDGVRVAPGDVLVGDTTGIVCVPAASAEQVLAMTRKLEADDRAAMAEIRNGLSFSQALSKFAKL
jgi:regulator of RNase E activity RraA